LRPVHGHSLAGELARRAGARPADHSDGMRGEGSMDNTITRIEAVPLRVPVEFARYGSARRRDCSLCHVEVETASGTVGYGLGYLADASVVAQLIDAVAAPAIMGE